MNLDDARKVIEDYLIANYTETPIFYDNTSTGKLPDEYIDFFILPGPGISASLGFNHERIFGIVQIGIYTPLETGASFSRADRIRQLVSNKDLSGILFTSADLLRIGPIEGKYKLQVSSSFSFEHFT